MYRILLVDDEANIVDALYDYITSKRPDSFDILKSYSGEDAMRFMESMRIDIVITDIMMPAINGVDLLKSIEARWPRCKVVFFTCHDDFDYAYQATNLKCFKYLLKYEGYENVLNTIDEAVAVLKDEVYGRTSTADRNSNAYLSGNMPQLLFEYLLQGEVYSSQQLQGQFRRLNLPFDSRHPVFNMMMKLFDQTGRMSYGEKRACLCNLASKLDLELSTQVNVYPYIAGSDSVFWFVQDNESQEQDVSVTVKGLLELLLSERKKSEQYKVEFVLCVNLTPWSFVADNYFVLNNLFTESFLKEEEILYFNNRNYIRIAIERIISTVFQAPGISTEQERLQAYGRLEELLQQTENLEEDRKLIINKLLCYLKRQEAYENSVIWRDTYNAVTLLRKKEDFTLYQLWDSMENCFHFIEKNNVHAIVLKEQAFIQQAKEYIAKNYEKNISLTDISEHVYLNPSYFSRIFKQQCGINVVDYVNKVRVDVAKELLRNTNMKIVDVAEKVGFNSSGYFSNVFRRYTGGNPKDYRN